MPGAIRFSCDKDEVSGGGYAHETRCYADKNLYDIQGIPKGRF